MASNFYTPFVGGERLPFPLSESLLSFDLDSSQYASANLHETPVCTYLDSDAESCHGNANGNYSGDYTTIQHHWLQQVRQSLNALLRERFKSFINTVQYVAPQNNTKSHDEEFYTSDGPVVSTRLMNLYGNTGHEYKDDGFVLISPPKRNLHYACPFEAVYPKRYRQCSIQHSLLTMDDVMGHLKRYHIDPLYCPMCSEIFETLIHRDRHIIKRSCELQELQVPKEINAHEENALMRLMKMNISDEERWNRIFATIFPNEKPPHSPYLDCGRRLAISVARDYFMVDGRRCVSELLQAQGLRTNVEGDQHAQVALCQLALEDLLSDIMERYRDADN
ncbi:unnamed protein product [Fusarium graminearum]|uniref:Uncharacterized protein n=1 Tax=Gibberella zeae TaxID=5518 RepID=A0A2H3GVM8_GIBZA|nr:hypothetical protein FGRA07_03541 [Fusarium graminearum]CAG2000152.1 unnamed protein product [Fusarium graminearum]CAG2006313.1 unnamed protein product [Fusarium graminearum]CZS82821.1 unnamed protein product [Fusarium graminearum]